MMNKLEHLELLWDTHDFHISKICESEKAFEELLVKIRDYSLKKKLLPGTERAAMVIKKLQRAYDETDCFLKKHINSIEELRRFYKNNPASIPDYRETSDEMFLTIKRTTQDLRVSYNEAFLILRDVLS